MLTYAEPCVDGEEHHLNSRERWPRMMSGTMTYCEDGDIFEVPGDCMRRY